MMRDHKTADKAPGISRRKFITGSGIIIGGLAAGAGALISACSPADVTRTVTLTTTRPQFVCPYDGKAFDTFEELTRYIAEEFPGLPPVNRYVSPYDGREFATVDEFRSYLDTLFSRAGYVRLNVNGAYYEVPVKAGWSLAFVLREKLGFTGTKTGCNRGSCGSCTVLVDGLAVCSCLMLAIEAENKRIVTVEGLSSGTVLHPVQQAFVDNDASQCGYCVPGFIMAAVALLESKPSASVDDIREALSGNLCICGNTGKMVQAVLICTQGTDNE